MSDIEIFDDFTDIGASKAVVSVYKVANGWLPSWVLEVRDDADISELLAIGDGLKLAQTQFDRLMDMILAED